MTEPFWTPETVAVLTEMLAEGAAYSDIGRRLGCSKSTVIGKAYRLGIAEGAPNSAGPRAMPRTLHDRMDAEEARMDAVLAETAAAIAAAKRLAAVQIAGAVG